MMRMIRMIVMMGSMQTYILKILTNVVVMLMLTNKDTYFTPINEDGEGRQCDPNKSVEGNCEGVDTLDLHQEVHPRRNCIKGHQPL